MKGNKTRSSWAMRMRVVAFFEREVPLPCTVTIAAIHETLGLPWSSAHCAVSELVELQILAVETIPGKRGWRVKRGQRFDEAGEIAQAAPEPPPMTPQQVVAAAMRSRHPIELAWMPAPRNVNLADSRSQ